MIGLSFRHCFRLRQSGFHYIVRNGVLSGVGRKLKRSDSSDSDCVSLMNPLTTPIFYFHYVISVLTTPTLSLVKTSLKTSLKQKPRMKVSGTQGMRSSP